MDHKFPSVPNSENPNHQHQYGAGYPQLPTQPVTNYNYNQGPPGPGKSIEMQPMMGSPYGYGPPGTPAPGFGFQQTAPAQFSYLQPLTEVFLDDATEDLLVVNGDGSVILKTDIEYSSARTRNGVGGAKTTFMTPNGQTVMFCKRKEFISTVTAGESEIGGVSGDFCSFQSSFTIKSEVGGTNMNLTPTGVMSGCYCCLCNDCAMVEYLITGTSSGKTLGTLTCAGGDRGPRHKITFDADLDVNSKALIIAASLGIYDIYFAPKSFCGHVGKKGNMCLWIWGWIGITFLGYIIIMIYFTLKGNDPELDEHRNPLNGTIYGNISGHRNA